MSNCDVKLYRKRQVLAELQDECDVPVILTAANGGIEVNVSPSANAEVSMVERDVARASLTKLLSIPGEITGSVQFSSDFKGPGATGILTTPPKVGKYLEACGLGKNQLYRFKITGLVAGKPIRPGAVLTKSTTVGVVAEIAYDARNPYLYVTHQVGKVGPANNDVLSVLNPGETVPFDVTVTSVETPWGFAYKPISSGHKYMTIRSEEDGFKKEIYAAMGNFKFSADANNLGKFEFDFKGLISKGYVAKITLLTGTAIDKGKVLATSTGDKLAVLLRGLSATTTAQEAHYVYTTNLGDFLPNGVGHFGATEAIYVDGVQVGSLSSPEINAGFGDMAMTTGVVYDSTTPQILQDARLVWTSNGKTYSPVFGSVSVDAGNNIVVRKNGNAFNGLATARLTDRKPVGSADPEMMNQVDFDLFNTWFNGIPAEFQFKLGDGDDGNSMFFYGKQTQFTGNSDGDRDGIAVVNSEFMFANNTDDQDYTIAFY